jgi:hypothetical protein
MRMKERLGMLLIALLAMLGCENEPTPPKDYELRNAVFTGADYFIETGIPAFDDTTDSTPTFTWIQTKQDLVFLGVFKGSIQIDENKIGNITDNVWAWHSKLGTAREGNVNFSDGRDVDRGQLLVDRPPTPLVPGQSYWWAVWAWDNEGLRVTYSSREMFFTVR